MDALEASVRRSLWDGHWAPLEVDFDVVLDLGCFTGVTTELYLVLCCPVHAIGVEMDRTNFEATKHVSDRHPNVEFVHAAVTGVEGEGSYDTQPARNVRRLGNGHETVRCVTLEWLLRPIPEHLRIFVKMDIEGEELAAINGPPWADKVDCILVDVHTPPNDRVDEVEEALRSLGFQTQRPRTLQVWGQK